MFETFTPGKDHDMLHEGLIFDFAGTDADESVVLALADGTHVELFGDGTFVIHTRDGEYVGDGNVTDGMADELAA